MQVGAYKGQKASSLLEIQVLTPYSFTEFLIKQLLLRTLEDISLLELQVLTQHAFEALDSGSLQEQPVLTVKPSLQPYNYLLEPYMDYSYIGNCSQ